MSNADDTPPLANPGTSSPPVSEGAKSPDTPVLCKLPPEAGGGLVPTTYYHCIHVLHGKVEEKQ